MLVRKNPNTARITRTGRTNGPPAHRETLPLRIRLFHDEYDAPEARRGDVRVGTDDLFDWPTVVLFRVDRPVGPPVPQLLQRLTGIKSLKDVAKALRFAGIWHCAVAGSLATCRCFNYLHRQGTSPLREGTVSNLDSSIIADSVLAPTDSPTKRRHGPRTREGSLVPPPL
jgi:hypothetical protein